MFSNTLTCPLRKLRITTESVITICAIELSFTIDHLHDDDTDISVNVYVYIWSFHPGGDVVMTKNFPLTLCAHVYDLGPKGSEKRGWRQIALKRDMSNMEHGCRVIGWSPASNLPIWLIGFLSQLAFWHELVCKEYTPPSLPPSTLPTAHPFVPHEHAWVD